MTFIISVRFFINILSLTTKSITPQVAIYVLFTLLRSVFVVSILKCIAQILQVADVLLPSNLKYPLTYALQRVHLKGEFTRTLCTFYEPNGDIHTPNGNCDFLGIPKVYAEVGLRKYGLAS